MSATPSRTRALDVAKGIAIVGIVLSHVMRGLAAGGQLDPLAPAYEEVDTGLYLVHLAVFVALAGVFLADSVQRLGVAGFLRRRWLGLGWVFVVWTLVQGGVQVLAGRLANTPVGLGDVAWGLVKPGAQLWFLPTLLLFSTVMALTRPWRRPATAMAAMLVGLAVTWWQWGVPGTWIFTQRLGLTAFFVAGVLCGPTRLRAALTHRATPAVAAVAALIFGLIGWASDPTNPTDQTFALRTPQSTALGIVAAVAGLVAVLGVAQALDRHADRLAAATAWLGRRSLEVFLAHIVFTAGTRIVLNALGVDSAPVQLLAGLVAGIVGPLVLLRLPLPWLFRPPRALLGHPAGTGAA